MLRARPSSRATLVFAFLAFCLALPPAFSQTAAPTSAGKWGILIRKSDITATAKFYPYSVNGKPMEVFAVRASDGTIRTALNTCQVCYSSGRGFYIQEGRVFVCQNCGNRFSLEQIEKIRGGCNPIPVLGADKTDLGESIGISASYLASVAPYFARWKR